MSKYIPFTTEQKERAASVDLEEFLRRRGEKLITSGRDKRLASDHSITIRGCEWFDHATEQGGRAISFVKQFYGLSYPDAMSLLLGDDLGGSYPAAKEKVPAPAKPFVLPPQSESMRRVYAYLLQKRCIDREILNSFVRKRLIYESCERSKDGTKEYHNAVFVGFDEHGVPRHGHKRGLYTMGQSYRGNIEGSDPQHSFHYLGGDDTLYVFEAPIDLLSYISLFPDGWQEHNYVACCGASSIPVLEMLRQLPQLRQVELHHIAVNGHFPKICAHVRRAELRHLRLDPRPFLRRHHAAVQQHIRRALGDQHQATRQLVDRGHHFPVRIEGDLCQTGPAVPDEILVKAVGLPQPHQCRFRGVADLRIPANDRIAAQQSRPQQRLL